MGLAWVRALGVFDILLFVSDTSSDTYVGVDLINRCHNGYAASVFSFVAMPGLLLGVVCGPMLILNSDVVKMKSLFNILPYSICLYGTKSRWVCN